MLKFAETHHLNQIANMMIRKYCLAAVALLSILIGEQAKAAETVAIAPISSKDSVEMQLSEPGPFHWRQLIAPAALIAAGTACAIDYDHGINKEVNDWISSSKHHNSVDDYLRFVPSAGYLAMGWLGIKAKHSTTDRLLVFATSHAAMLAMGYGLKAVVDEWRPNHEDEDAMPSGHALLSFTGAELIREEYGNYWGLGSYAIATATAVLRLHNNAHWLGDVLMGAGMGALSARIGYWLLPLERKWLGIDKKNNVAIIPSYNGYNHAMGLGLVAVF